MRVLSGGRGEVGAGGVVGMRKYATVPKRFPCAIANRQTLLGKLKEAQALGDPGWLQEGVMMDEFWSSAFVLALMVLSTALFAREDGKQGKIGQIKICQSQDVSGEVIRGSVVLPAGAEFYQAADESAPGGRVEVVTDGPVSLSLLRRDCAIVPARLLLAERPVRVGDTLRARWSLPGVTPTVTVVGDFK